MTQTDAYTYEYPRPMVTVDAVVLAVSSGRLDVLLIKRKHEPFKGRWALPGGFIEMEEPLETAVRRELFEETGLSRVPLEELGVFGDPGRDPRGRTISVAYVAVLDGPVPQPRAGDDAGRAQWFPVANLPELAFDHKEIITRALAKVAHDAASTEHRPQWYNAETAEIIRNAVAGMS